MTKAKAKVTPINATPTVRIEDYHHLTGPLYNAQGYPTFKGRCILQVVQNTAYSAFCAAKGTREQSVIESAAAEIEKEMTASPYKEGIDASLVTFEKPELADKRPRKDLVFDLLHREDIDPELTEKLVTAVKMDGINNQIKSLVKKQFGTGSGGSGGIGRRISVGSQALEEMDESWDEAFLTKAVEFLIDYTDEKYLRSEDDIGNHSYMKAVLAGVQVGEEEAPLVYAI